MNFRRGFVRLWLVASICFAVVYVAPKAPGILDEFFPGRSSGRYLDQYRDTHPWRALAEIAQIAFGIPAAVFVIGMSLLWAANGFRRGGRSN
jgi:hypothetical protein